MKRKFFKYTSLAVIALGLAACSNQKATDDAKTTASDSQKTEDTVLEFYHGYHQSKDEWPVAQTMRDLYDKFAEEHKDSGVTFKPIPVSGSLTDVMNNKVASGQFPDVIDLAGQSLSLASIEQGLVLDMKPFVDEQKLQKNVGLNYVQNMVDGKLYTVHEQLFTMGLWYNKDIFEKAGAKTPEQWKTWEDFTGAMSDVRKQEGVYAFGAGQPAIRVFNTLLGTTEEGRKLLTQPFTKATIESDTFKDALKKVMTEVQANGSQNAGGDANAYSADFIQNKSAVFFNGVWAAGGMVENPSIAPGIYPQDVAISSAGGGITISSKLSDKKKELALEFMKYMTSDEVQKVIFEKVGANPSNENIDVAKLSQESSDSTVKLLGQAITQVKQAKQVVTTVSTAWGGDVETALINAISESAAEGVNIDQKVADTQQELLAIIN